MQNDEKKTVFVYDEDIGYDFQLKQKQREDEEQYLKNRV